MSEASALIDTAPVGARPPIRRPAALGFAVLLAFFGGFLGWAATAPLDSAAIVQGQVGIDTNRKAVQHLEGGIVREILVRERDTVRAGQLLVRLDDTQLKSKLRQLQSQLVSETRQRKLVQDEETVVRDMLKKGNATLPRLLQLQRRLAELDGSLAQAKEQIVSISDSLSRLDVKAPIDGTVVGLQVHTAGGVVAPGTTMMEIVPANDALIVEARLDPNDIDAVRAGQVAYVRFTPYGYRASVPEKGTVAWVSADRMNDPKTGQGFYLARIVMARSPGELGITLYPGMPIEAMIVTGRRTALGYFMAPLTRSLDRAFRQD